jgi:hypothetical protein
VVVGEQPDLAAHHDLERSLQVAARLLQRRHPDRHVVGVAVQRLAQPPHGPGTDFMLDHLHRRQPFASMGPLQTFNWQFALKG